MKILHIRGKNIASLPEFHLDLERGLLAEAGVFAITGPTGAGKSTLLDTLCLALFDRAPRFESRSRSTAREGLAESDPRNCLRRGTAHGVAEVVFRGREAHVYKATWSVKRAYLKPDGRLGASALAFENLTTSANLTGAGKKETLEAIERALGLGFEQFCRSVLLAQGEFAQFLKSPPNEKAQLLESLTGTGVFGEISKTAFRLARARAHDVKILEAETAALAASLGEGTQGRSVDDTRRQVGEALAAHETRLAALDARRTEEEKALSEVEALLALVVRQRLIHSELESLHVRGVSVHADLARAQEALVHAQGELEILEATHETNREVHEQAKALESALATLEDTRARLAHDLARKTAERDTALAQAAALEKAAAQLERPEDTLESPHPLLAPLVAAAQKKQRQAVLLSQAEAHGRALREDCERSGATPEALLKPAEGARLLVREREALSKLAHLLASAAEAARKRIDAQQARDAALHARDEERARAERTEEALVAARETLAQAESDWSIALQHDDIRARRGLLVAGAPCPLCGSLAHPAVDAPTHVPGTEEVSPLTKALERERVAAAKRVEDLSRTAAAARARLPDLQREHDTQAAHAAAACALLARLRAQVADADAGAEPFTPRTLSFLETCETTPSTTALGESDVAPAVRERLARVDALLPLLSALQESRVTYQERKAAFREDELHLAATTAEVRERVALAREAAAATAHAADTERARAEARRGELEHQARTVREARGALPADAAAVFRASETRLAEGKRMLVRAQEAMAKAATTAANVEGAREEKERAAATLVQEIAAASGAATDIAEDALKARVLGKRETLSLLGEETRALSLECGRLAAKRDALEEAWRRHCDLSVKLARARENAQRWEALSSLIGSADGALFRRKAQSITLAFLVEGTNETLERLCPRYRLLCTQGTDLDLLVSDTWMDDAPRSVSTLSGGETFLISLALALGLSHLSSRHVFLGTLFVDEGFGTLDPVTLETTLAMFDALQSDGRQVGLISHVPGLAERLGARVVVTPRGQGASVLTVED